MSAGEDPGLGGRSMPQTVSGCVTGFARKVEVFELSLLSEIIQIVSVRRRTGIRCLRERTGQELSVMAKKRLLCILHYVNVVPLSELADKRSRLNRQLDCWPPRWQ